MKCHETKPLKTSNFKNAICIKEYTEFTPMFNSAGRSEPVRLHCSTILINFPKILLSNLNISNLYITIILSSFGKQTDYFLLTI